MSHRTRTAGLVAALVVAVLAPLGWASPSQASTQSDTSAALYQNCIDWTEFQSASRTGTMSATEDYFGATGRVVHVGNGGTTIIKQYHWCGYGESAVMVQISYVLNKRGQWIAQYAIKYDYRDRMQHQPAARTL